MRKKVQFTAFSGYFAIKIKEGFQNICLPQINFKWGIF